MDPDSKPSFIERLTSLLLREPEDREQLLEILHSAYERNLMDADALTIIEQKHQALLGAGSVGRKINHAALRNAHQFHAAAVGGIP